MASGVSFVGESSRISATCRMRFMSENINMAESHVNLVFWQTRRNMRANVSDLLGKTLTRVVRLDDEEEILFESSNGEVWSLNHHPDCCEDVIIEDISGNLNDLVGLPILIAEEIIHKDKTPDGMVLPIIEPKYHPQIRFTWTFYKFATQKGHVTIRWYGQSNGYYSEEVDFDKIKCFHSYHSWCNNCHLPAPTRQAGRK